ncbi:MAG: C39 family peptidase [Myxococcales bacterium]|nr:C39 family peptidase [Myxococcales bacterium]MDP3498681.1 C39 family peptidase [Myxococcales bacterium]
MRIATSTRPAPLARASTKPTASPAPRGHASSFAPVRRPLVRLDGVAGPKPAATAAPVAGPTIVNQKLHDYLTANPKIRTSQDLINATWKKGTFDTTCKELGLDSRTVLKYRSASLMGFAVRPVVSDGKAPTTVEQANRVFVTQYQHDTYNRESPNSWSNNCGPTSLAMVLKVNGKMPQGLTNEQQIDYARGLMYPKLAKTDGKDVALPSGETVRVLDIDKMLTNVTSATAGMKGGGLEGASHQKGWAAFDDALDAGKSLVVEGNISSTYKAAFKDEATATGGSYQGGGNGHFMAVLGKTSDGKYLVADPMFSGGTVEMTRDEVANFFAKQGGDPSFVSP